jgi:hypothetical protein
VKEKPPHLDGPGDVRGSSHLLAGEPVRHVTDVADLAPPDQVIVMSRRAVPTGLPWWSELLRSWKSSISKSSSIHVARPLPGDTLTDRDTVDAGRSSKLPRQRSAEPWPQREVIMM